MENYTKETNQIKKTSILVIDDDESIRELLSLYFENIGYEVVCLDTGETAAELLHSKHFDVIILDIMLPGKDGMDVCKEIRKFSETPIIMLTAKTDEVDKVLGLEIGADDYMTKPFSTRELLARVKSVMRRSVVSPMVDEQQILAWRDLTVNRVSREVTVGEEKIILTPKEFELLWYLASNKNKVFTREQLLEKVWAYQEFYGDERTVDQHIKRLRKKLETAGCTCRITTIWGVGYKFESRDATI